MPSCTLRSCGTALGMGSGVWQRGGSGCFIVCRLHSHPCHAQACTLTGMARLPRDMRHPLQRATTHLAVHGPVWAGWVVVLAGRSLNLPPLPLRKQRLRGGQAGARRGQRPLGVGPAEWPRMDPFHASPAEGWGRRRGWVSTQFQAWGRATACLQAGARPPGQGKIFLAAPATHHFVPFRTGQPV